MTERKAYVDGELVTNEITCYTKRKELMAGAPISMSAAAAQVTILLSGNSHEGLPTQYKRAPI